MKIKSLLVTAVLATAILGFGFVASAQTTDVSALIAQLQAQIQSLMQQIQQLQAQQNGTQTWCYTFNTNLGFSQSGNADVGALHTILDKQGFSYAPDTGNTYDEGTAHAVIQFQTKYRILQTGYVGVLTRAKLNSLYGCGTNPTPVTTCDTNYTGESPIYPISITSPAANPGNSSPYPSADILQATAFNKIIWNNINCNPNTKIFAVLKNASGGGGGSWTISDPSGVPSSQGYVNVVLPQDLIQQATAYGQTTNNYVIFLKRVDNTNIVAAGPYIQLNFSPTTCTPNWQCTAWSTCTNGQQTRTCTDSNNCGTTNYQPALIQTCGSTQSSITVIAPAGGEVLTENSKLVGSLSSVDSQNQIFEIKWSGTPNPSSDAYSIVRAYLEQNVNGQFTTIGSIVPESYGSIMWIVGEVGDANCDVFSSTGFAVNPSACIENKMVAPGTYDIKIVNTQTNTFGRSNNFTIVASPNPSTCVPNWQCQWGQCLANSKPWMAVDSNNCGSMAGVPFCAYKTQQCATPPVTINPINPSSGSVGSTLTITGTNFDSKYNEIMFGCSTDGSIVGANVYNIPSSDGKTINTTVPHIMAGAGVSGSLGVEVSYPINCTVSLSNNTGITSNNVPFTVTASGSTQTPITVTSPSSGEVVHAGSPYVIKWSAPQNLISAFPNVDIVMSVVLPPSNCGSSGCGLAPSNNIFAKVLQNIFGIEHVNAAGPLYFIIATNVPLSQGSYQWNVPSDITSQILNYDIGYQILFYKAGSNMSIYGPPNQTTVPIAPYKSNIFTLAPGTTSMNVPQNSLASISDAVKLIAQELQSLISH